MIRKLILLAIMIVFVILVIPLLFGRIVGIDIFSFGLSFFVAIILAAILLGISGFLPFKWGKYLREICYIVLFIALLMFFMGVIQPYVTKTELQLADCVNVFFPKLERDQQEGQIVYNALAYTGCVLTGKYPQEAGDIGWSVFFLFYLILPFAFIFSLVYGLMKGIGFENIFGKDNTGKYVSTVLSFIISMYAARTLMGAFILHFIGYGAWGLAAVFGSIFLVLGLKKLVEGWFKIEEMGKKTREMIEKQLRWEAQFAHAVLPLVEKAYKLAENEDTLPVAKQVLSSIKDDIMYSTLREDTRKIINWYIERANAATSARGFREKLEELKRFLKIVEKSK